MVSPILNNTGLPTITLIRDQFASPHQRSRWSYVSVARFSTRRGSLQLLANFEAAKSCDDISENRDLTDLGLLLLDCMEGHVLLPEKRQLDYINGQRQRNRVFGLSKAELWSGSKQLIDFLDELFNKDRSARSKFARPVSLPKKLVDLPDRYSTDLYTRSVKILNVFAHT